MTTPVDQFVCQAPLIWAGDILTLASLGFNALLILIQLTLFSISQLTLSRLILTQRGPTLLWDTHLSAILPHHPSPMLPVNLFLLTRLPLLSTLLAQTLSSLKSYLKSMMTIIGIRSKRQRKKTKRRSSSHSSGASSLSSTVSTKQRAIIYTSRS